MRFAVWSHPAVIGGAQRVTRIAAGLTDEEVPEFIARAFLPFGIEGIDALRIHSISEA